VKKQRTLDLLNISPYVRYVHACIDAIDAGHQIPWRCIYDYEFLFVADGELTVVTEKGSYLLRENTIHTIPPMIYHTLQIPQGQRCSYYSVHFDFIDLGRENDFSPEEVYIANCNRNLETAPINEQLKRRPLYALGSMALPEAMTVNDPIAYTAHLKQMINLQHDKPFAWEIDMKCGMLSILKLILHDIKRVRSEKKPHMEHFSDITAYLFDHYAEAIDFEHLSRTFGYSYSSFRKHFKERTGKSPHEYLTDLRLSRAVTLLQTGRYSVTEVALTVGYNDTAYFSRLFRLKKGCSPSSFFHIYPNT